MCDVPAAADKLLWEHFCVDTSFSWAPRWLGEYNLMHHSQNSRAAEILLHKHNLLEGNVDTPAEDAAAKPEAHAEDAGAEPEAPPEEAPGTGAGADAEDALAGPAGEEPAADNAEPVAEPSAEPAAKPHAESALPHISNFYTRKQTR